MRNPFVLFVLSAIALFVSQTQAFEITHTPGWNVKLIPPGTASLTGLSSEVQATLNQEQDDTEGLQPSILVFKRSIDTKKLKLTKEWRKAIFNDKNSKRVFLNEAVIEKNDQPRYLAEFQTDTGTENSLNSIVMAVAVDAQIYVFVFENDRNLYLQKVSQIRNLLLELKINK